MALIDVVRHLIHYGPARNEAEREQLLAQLDDDKSGSKPAAPPPAADGGLK